MTIRNFLQNYVAGILITGTVYAVIYTIKEGLESALTAKDFLGLLLFPLGLGVFALIFSIPYMIVMVITIARTGMKELPTWNSYKGMQILLSVITMTIAYLASDNHREGMQIVGLILGYAITGTLLIFYPIRTIYLYKNKTQN